MENTESGDTDPEYLRFGRLVTGRCWTMLRETRAGGRRAADTSKGTLAPDLEPTDVLGCPVEESLGIFGRKWSILIIRDLTFYPGITFGQLLRRNPGLAHRTLSIRLGELGGEGLIEKTPDSEDDRIFHYRLTAKGLDAVPIMVALASYGLAHRSEKVFTDGRTRSLSEIFPGKAKQLLGRIADFATGSA